MAIDPAPHTIGRHSSKTTLNANWAAVAALELLVIGANTWWPIDSIGRQYQFSSGAAYAGTAGATITPADGFLTPFVGSVRIDLRHGVANTYTYNGGGNPYVVYQHNSWVLANGNVWAVGLAGTANALTSDAKAWGVAGVGYAAVANAAAHGAEFNVCTDNTVGGDFTNSWGLGIGVGSSGVGSNSYATGYQYWGSNSATNAAQNGLVIRDEGRNPLKTSSYIITTGFNAGLGGSAHLSVTGFVDFRNTTFSGRVFRFGPSTSDIFYIGKDGDLAFTGNAGLYAINNAGTPVKVIDHDAASTLTRYYGPAGSVAHLQMTTTQVYIDATTLNLRNNSGTQMGLFNSTGLLIAPSYATATPDALLTLSGNTGALPTAVGANGIHIGGADSGTSELLMDTFGGSNSVRWRRANGTLASKTALAADDTIGNMSVRGHNGTDYTTGNQGNFSFLAAEAWSGSTNSTYFQIAVVPTTTTGNATQIIHARYVGNNTVPRVGIGNFGTTAPSYTLSLDKNVARTIGMERTTGTVGLGLTISADAAVSGGTNRAGGNLTLASGISTGSGTSDIIFQTSPNTAGATSDNTIAEVVRVQGLGWLKFAASNFQANGTGTVTISNVAPAGVATATITKWLRIDDGSGVDSYMPVWQ